MQELGWNFELSIFRSFLVKAKLSGMMYIVYSPVFWFFIMRMFWKNNVPLLLFLAAAALMYTMLGLTI